MSAPLSSYQKLWYICSLKNSSQLPIYWFGPSFIGECGQMEKGIGGKMEKPVEVGGE